MTKRCYNRFNDGIYLQTCLKPDRHPDAHQGDDGVTWVDAQGWFDNQGEVKRNLPTPSIRYDLELSDPQLPTN